MRQLLPLAAVAVLCAALSGCGYRIYRADDIRRIEIGYRGLGAMEASVKYLDALSKMERHCK